MEYRVDDRSLTPEGFLAFVDQIWPGGLRCGKDPDGSGADPQHHRPGRRTAGGLPADPH